MRPARSHARPRFRSLAVTAFAALAALCLGSAAATAAQWSEVVLYTFCSKSSCGDGLNPQGGVVPGPDGNLWGTALQGGDHNAGAVFDLVMPGVSGPTQATDTLIGLHAFCGTPSKDLGCPDGALPVAGLTAGRLGFMFGTTLDGGQGGPPGTNGGGTVFEVLPGGQFKTLHEFCKQGHPCLAGASPAYGLVGNAKGNAFFGTTTAGGRGLHAGTVFRVTSAGHMATVYAFCSVGNCRDGQTPSSALIRDAKGNLYGTTLFGGDNGQGTVFKVNASGNEQVLYSFCSQANCADGQQPSGKLVRDGAGNIFGTASAGGSANGAGVVFEIDSGGNFNPLYTFCAAAPCIDGRTPSGGLVIDSAGNLYGTTEAGGNTEQGTFFEVPAGGGSETVLHSFCDTNEPVCTSGLDGNGNFIPDGSTPLGPLMMDEECNIFGTTDWGGGNTQGGVVSGGGTIYEMVNPSPGKCDPQPAQPTF